MVTVAGGACAAAVAAATDAEDVPIRPVNPSRVMRPPSAIEGGIDGGRG